MTNTHQVWLVLNSRSFGGIETHVLELAKGLANYAIRCQIFTVKPVPLYKELLNGCD